MTEMKLPFSREAEVHVLASILIEPDLAEEYCGRISVDDFYDETHRKIFAAMEKLYKQKKTVDTINVIEALKKLGFYESVGDKYLSDLVESIPSIFSSGEYVNILKEKSLARELYAETTALGKRILMGNEDIGDLIASAERTITVIADKQQTGKLIGVSSALDRVFNVIDFNRERSEGSLIGVNTGYRELNEFTFGFQPGELVILAARPGVGKSALALNIAYNSASTGANVAFFSLEMGIDQLMMRLLGITSTVKLSQIRNGNLTNKEVTFLQQARLELNELNIYLDETTNSSMEDLKVQCRKLKRENKLDFIIVDYLQLLTAGKGKNISRYEEVSSLSRSLKQLARELRVPVLALSQLSRAVETRTAEEGKKPILSDLRESGSIEQDADIVLFMHSERSINRNDTRQATIEIIVAKNRQGITGSFHLLFKKEYSKFNDLGKKE